MIHLTTLKILFMLLLFTTLSTFKTTTLAGSNDHDVSTKHGSHHNFLRHHEEETSTSSSAVHGDDDVETTRMFIATTNTNTMGQKEDSTTRVLLAKSRARKPYDENDSSHHRALLDHDYDPESWYTDTGTSSRRTTVSISNTNETNTTTGTLPDFIPGGNVTCKIDASILTLHHVLKGVFGLEEVAAFLTAKNMYRFLSIDAQRKIDTALYHIPIEPGLHNLALYMLEMFQHAINDLGMVFMVEQIASVQSKFAPAVVEIMEFMYSVDGYPQEGIYSLASYWSSTSTDVDGLVQSILSCFHYEMPCKDNDDYHYLDEATFCLRTCSLIGRLDTSYRLKLCQVQEVMDNCPTVCGMCCEDDASYEIMVHHNNNTYYRGCSWLTENPTLTQLRKETYCEQVIGDNEKTAWHYCTYSCGTCPEPPPDCDDGNLCTIDSLDFETGELQCKHEPVVCEEGKICESFSGLCREIQQVVPCIAVIDEWNDRNYDTEWNLFRQSYPLRPFCLLVPGRSPIDRLPVGFFNDTLSPDGVDRTIALEVNRDDGNTTLTSEWLTLCELDKLSNNSIDFVGLFVDTSGSMTLSTVQASYDKFVNVDSKAAGLNIVSVFNGNENWIYPFRSELVPSS